MSSIAPLQVMNTAALRLQPMDSTALVLTVCDTVLGDERGGLYRWDATRNDDEDMAFLNVVKSGISQTGRWIRFAVRARQLPQGLLTNINGVKTLTASGVISSASECVFNLTMDNLPDGEPIFTVVNDNRAYTKAYASSPAGSIVSYPKALASNLKTTTHGFYKPVSVVAILGTAVLPYGPADTGSPVGLTVMGR